LIIVAIVGAIIGFGALASLMNPSNDNDDSIGGGSRTTIPTIPAIPNVQPDTDLQPNLERTTDDTTANNEFNGTTGSAVVSNSSGLAANNDNWSIVLE
jgi:hypothetical protein